MSASLAAAWTAPVRAIDIEALLVWTYRRQRADVVVGRGYGLHAMEAELDGAERYGSSACGVAAVERIGLLGTRVDGGGPGSGALHPDAELVHEAVMRLVTPHRLLILRHAKAGTRPETMAGVVPRPSPVMTPRGFPKMRYADWDKQHNYGWAEVAWTPSWAAIDAARAEYALWHRLLHTLALSLKVAGRLANHDVLAPVAPPPVAVSV